MLCSPSPCSPREAIEMRTSSFAGPVDYETYGHYAMTPPAEGAVAKPLYRFQGRITADGSSGYLAEPGRYHLYIALACPWAHRSAIVRKLKGLGDVISLSLVDDVRD